MMQTLERMLESNIALMVRCGVAYQSWQHELILDFETDERVGHQLGWTATPTKSLFLSFKNGEYALLLTHRDARLDSKKVKALIGKRPSIASDDEMIAQLGCVPGAVCPFGIPESITLIVDDVLFSFDALMYTPGPPEYTFAFDANCLSRLLAALPNPVLQLGMS
ncbi:YbaK/EbsC family protein [Enterovibrio nigricans]|uniref:Ala-tRNA(Pro) deacylase n=1 Tax=Enterovibrio nigricans DSM 22720 TaxID=1121868 RepID=A0A1T4TZC6_9GAMM|nr:YbaK/EbsC family protein [Enterovibrio nigricans]PKF51675.1 DNA-binding protein [Enterovibrio nigricans]SKA45784.1 Ala-tRNA(Pro) deacylase [Enterovibrio nigricans DSM 22720]